MAPISLAAFSVNKADFGHKMSIFCILSWLVQKDNFDDGNNFWFRFKLS